ncbi:MAG: D-2-hydroxyacid dehydrogenase [Lachnospiraceae bacterium]
MEIVIMEGSTLGDDVNLSGFNLLGDVVVYEKSNPEENADRIKNADIIVVNKIPVNEELLKNASKVKLISLTATGTNNVDFDYTNSRGLTVTNVSGYSTQSVAQHTFAMLFYIYEHLSLYDTYVKSGEYSRDDTFSFFGHSFHELAGKTWGIIGLGAIGRRVAEIARCFGCRVIYFSTSGNNNSTEYERKTLDELLSQSDIVSIHSPLNSSTENLISDKEFDMMKKDAVILNLGRGKIVDEPALYRALSENKIMGAGLDVLAVEPMDKENPLLQFRDSGRLLITPHMAWGTVEARQRCVDEVIENIRCFLNGEVRNVVK